MAAAIAFVGVVVSIVIGVGIVAAAGFVAAKNKKSLIAVAHFQSLQVCTSYY